jgi:hypothetical protein
MIAKIDVGHGRYKVRAYGSPFRGANEYARLLKERYGIEFHYIDFCTVSRIEMDYADAYNEVCSAAIKRRFGNDVFKDVESEAEKEWTAAQPPEPSK